jgi:hypothetical protein
MVHTMSLIWAKQCKTGGKFYAQDRDVRNYERKSVVDDFIVVGTISQGPS